MCWRCALPRGTLICSNSFRRFHTDVSGRFEELRELCTVADDKGSLAMGMAGLMMEHVIRGRLLEASHLASEYMALVESIGHPAVKVALTFASCVAKFQVGELEDVLRWSQAVIDLDDGEPEAESIILGSPLAMAWAFRGTAKWSMGLAGWREDLQRAVTMSRTSDAVSHVAVVTYTYIAIPRGVLVADDSALADIDTAMQMAERSSEDIALVMIRMMQGIALIASDSRDSQRGYDMLAELYQTCMKEQFALNLAPALQLYASQQMIEHGNLDGAVALIRSAAEGIFSSRNIFNCDTATAALVHALLARRTERDLAEAEVAIERLARTLPGSPWAVRDIFVVRLGALLAQARGDETAYRDLRNRYRTMAAELGFEGHIKWAAEMP